MEVNADRGRTWLEATMDNRRRTTFEEPVQVDTDPVQRLQASMQVSRFMAFGRSGDTTENEIAARREDVMRSNNAGFGAEQICSGDGESSKPTMDSGLSPRHSHGCNSIRSLTTSIQSAHCPRESANNPRAFAGNTVASCAEKMSCPPTPYQRKQLFVARVFESAEFEWVIGLAIVGNSVAIGMEQSWRLQGKISPGLTVVENIFLTFFLLELLGRVFAFGLACFKSTWIVFDLVLVSISVVVGWIMSPFLDDMEHLDIFMVLRTVRLLRLGRTLRLLIHFKELWMLVRGLLGSAYTIMYTLLILMAIIFMFASVGVEVISNNKLADPEEGDLVFAHIVEENFKTLGGTMLTLIQFATLDSAAAIYLPLIKREPYLILYFAALIVVLGIVLMNLITAVVVNSALEQAMQDKDMLALDSAKRKKKLIQDLSEIFQRLDTDQSGEITRDEFAQLVGEDKILLSQFLTIDDPMDIFDALDVNENGALSIEEFCDVLWMASCNRGAVEMKRTEKKLDALKDILEESKGVKTTPFKSKPRRWTRNLDDVDLAKDQRPARMARLRPEREENENNEPPDDSRQSRLEKFREHAAMDTPLWATFIKQSLIREMHTLVQPVSDEIHEMHTLIQPIYDEIHREREGREGPELGMPTHRHRGEDGPGPQQVCSRYHSPPADSELHSEHPPSHAHALRRGAAVPLSRPDPEQRQGSGENGGLAEGCGGQPHWPVVPKQVTTMNI